jgi:hypothetical protein
MAHRMISPSRSHRKHRPSECALKLSKITLSDNVIFSNTKPRADPYHLSVAQPESLPVGNYTSCERSSKTCSGRPRQLAPACGYGHQPSRRCQLPPYVNGDHRGMLGSRDLGSGDQVAVAGSIGPVGRLGMPPSMPRLPVGAADRPGQQAQSGSDIYLYLSLER